MAEKFLNGTQVSAISEKMGCKRVAEGVGMQVPIYVDETDVFLDDAADGALRETTASVIQKNGLRVRRVAVTAAAAGGLQE